MDQRGNRRRVPARQNALAQATEREFQQDLPGAPAGDYAVAFYDTSFEHKKAAVETVTSMLDQDGVWRVSGYMVK